jgi:transcriptional regulator with GAF, ATPase, and Fis domain
VSSVRDEIDVTELAQINGGHTEQLRPTAAPSLQRFRLTALEAPDAASWDSTGDRLRIGSHASNDVVLDDPAVSRFHCEIKVTPRGAWVTDLGSSNGTTLDGVQLGSGCLRAGSVVRLGRVALQFQPVESIAVIPVSQVTQFGSLVGVSWVMRSAFFMLERAAQSEVTVLIEGETGTGKEGAAESIHAGGPRKDQPFIVVDCSALPGQLLESELFGHERGAFTGASSQRRGAFEAANGGTLFLDEIGELPLDLQPKLLRALEKREIRRLGANHHLAVDVRIIAATNRDLRTLVNQGTFRSDIYYRLAVLEVNLPPLRERPEDIPTLVQSLTERMRLDPALIQRLFGPQAVARLQKAAWPGNVRELRNFVERCAVMDHALPVGSAAPESGVEPGAGFEVDATLTYAEAKRRVLDAFERQYLTQLLDASQGNVSRAARQAELDRPYLYKLLHRHGLRDKG